jgi:hypothetical protein
MDGRLPEALFNFSRFPKGFYCLCDGRVQVLADTFTVHQDPPVHVKEVQSFILIYFRTLRMRVQKTSPPLRRDKHPISSSKVQFHVICIGLKGN